MSRVHEVAMCRVSEVPVTPLTQCLCSPGRVPRVRKTTRLVAPCGCPQSRTSLSRVTRAPSKEGPIAFFPAHGASWLWATEAKRALARGGPAPVLRAQGPAQLRSQCASWCVVAAGTLAGVPMILPSHKRKGCRGADTSQKLPA